MNFYYKSKKELITELIRKSYKLLQIFLNIIMLTFNFKNNCDGIAQVYLFILLR